MFTYENLDEMGRAILLKKQKESVAYWKQLWHLKKIFVAFDDSAKAVDAVYSSIGLDPEVRDTFAKASKTSANTLRKLLKELEKIDGYLREIDARLADGTKWYTATEIADMIKERQS